MRVLERRLRRLEEGLLSPPETADSRRLRESRFRPAAEAMVVEIQYVSPDGSVEDGPQFTIPTGSAGLAGGGWPRFAGRQYREDREDLHP
jgi:hypothetical protein